ncbi:MAG: hypothetical protein A2498_10495, partial [Lentisphaerae bacterium RIFOXYC12_FULL_60_16]
MKPLCHIFEEIVSLENLFRAAEATLRHGRRFRGEGAGFKFNLEKEVFKLHAQLAAGRYRHGRYRLFTVWDPKVRVIAAASVRDRVLHHAVHDVIAPRLDRMFIHDSYACRSGKGTHGALDRAHGFLRANEYGLHLDVKSYFQSIDHEILKGLLRRYVADERALELLIQIVDSTDYLAHGGGAGASVTSLAPTPGGQMTLDLGLDRPPDAAAGGRIRGVPLGNLTSQFFANLYLNELDQYVKHALKVRYYARYMDDMLMFAAEKDPLLEWEGAIRDFARGELRLELHPGGGPRPVRRGIGFLGFRLFPGYRKLKKTSVTRFIRRMNGYTSEYFALAPDRQKQAALLSEIRQSTQSFHAHALNGSTYWIRKCLYDRFPIINQYGLAGMKGRWLGPDKGSRRGRQRSGAALVGGSRWRSRGAARASAREGRRDGYAADRGKDVRPERMAPAEGRKVPARSAVSAWRTSHGQGAGHPGCLDCGGDAGERGSETRDACAGGPGSGSTAVSVEARPRQSGHESEFVALLRE